MVRTLGFEQEQEVIPHGSALCPGPPALILFKIQGFTTRFSQVLQLKGIEAIEENQEKFQILKFSHRKKKSLWNKNSFIPFLYNLP